jgi:carbon starvation protein CstA
MKSPLIIISVMIISVIFAMIIPKLPERQINETEYAALNFCNAMHRGVHAKEIQLLVTNKLLILKLILVQLHILTMKVAEYFLASVRILFVKVNEKI